MNEFDRIKEEMKKLAYQEIQKQTPLEIRSLYKKYPPYFKTCSRATFRNGRQDVTVECDPFPCDGYYNKYFLCSPEFAEKIGKLEVKLHKTENELLKTKDSIVAAMLSFRTFKRVKEGFSEAYNHIKKYEESQNTAIALPVVNIMDTINKYKTSEDASASAI